VLCAIDGARNSSAPDPRGRRHTERSAPRVGSSSIRIISSESTEGRPIGAAERGQARPHALQVHKAVDGAEQMVLGNVPLQRELVEQLGLIDPPLAHHACALPPQQE
jgi:hypothetical protein